MNTTGGNLSPCGLADSEEVMVQVANSSFFRSQGRSASSREPSLNTPPPSPGPGLSSVLAPKPPRASSIRQALELPMIGAPRIVSSLFLPQGLCPCCFLCLYLSDMPNAYTLTLLCLCSNLTSSKKASGKSGVPPGHCLSLSMALVPLSLLTGSCSHSSLPGGIRGLLKSPSGSGCSPA